MFLTFNFLQLHSTHTELLNSQPMESKPSEASLESIIPCPAHTQEGGQHLFCLFLFEYFPDSQPESTGHIASSEEEKDSWREIR